ncbi:hypothetical protein ABH994_003650 [Bradyrhizobium yuanmingense]|uniref:hypothetical protein n=1 Tax=Bradyrhizobium yuanmingense TaxID=108015 RepID=UPI0035182E3A
MGDHVRMQDVKSSVARLVRSVEVSSRPSNVNFDALSKAITWCLDWFRDARKYSTGKHEATRHRVYREALPLARKLASLLNNEILWDDIHCPRPETTSRKIVQQLIERLQSEADAASRSDEDLYKQSFKDWTPFERLFGDYLVAVFVAAGFSGADTVQARAAKDGPYIRFAITFARLFEISQSDGTPYAVDSFVKATKRHLVHGARKRLKSNSMRAIAPGFFESWHRGRCEELRKLFDPPRE